MITEVTAVVIVLLAATLQGFFGFGYALFGVPLLTWAFGGDAKTAVVFSTITVAFHEAVMLTWAAKRAPWGETLWLVVAIGLGTALGLEAFGSMKSPHLMLILGTSLVFIGGWKLSGWTPGGDGSMPFKVHWALTAGVATGFIGVLTCATGPPLIIYASLRGWSPKFIKAFLQPLFVVSIALRMGGYMWQGEVSSPILYLGLIAGVPTLLVTWLGLRLSHKAPKHIFDRGFYVLVCVLGAITFAKAFLK